MASVTSIYNHARFLAGSGALDVNTGNIVALLVTSAYTPNLDTHQFLSSITNELTGNGYARQTLTYAGVTRLSEVAASNKSIFTSENVEYTAAGGSLVARRLILFKDTGVAGTSPLLCSVLLDATPADVTATDGNKIRVTPDAVNGWFYL